MKIIAESEYSDDDIRRIADSKLREDNRDWEFDGEGWTTDTEAVLSSVLEIIADELELGDLYFNEDTIGEIREIVEEEFCDLKSEIGKEINEAQDEYYDGARLSRSRRWGLKMTYNDQLILRQKQEKISERNNKIISVVCAAVLPVLRLRITNGAVSVGVAPTKATFNPMYHLRKRINRCWYWRF